LRNGVLGLLLAALLALTVLVFVLYLVR